MQSKMMLDGLIVTLKKRKLFIEGRDPGVEKNHNEFLVLGHFDQMNINYIDSWLKMTPYHTEAISLKDEYMDKYSLKGYFPREEKRKIYQRDGFNYKIWEMKEEDNKPFVIASVINISDMWAKEIVSEKKEICDAFVEMFEKEVTDSRYKESWKQMNAAVFPIIGYSDFLLMFKTDDVRSVLNIISILKQKKIRKVPCLSNAYTVIGFRNSTLNTLDNKRSERVELSIRFGLKAGITSIQFKKKLDEILGDKIGRSYRVLGDSDIMLVMHAPLSEILPLYFRDKEAGIFCPGSDIFQCIRNMQTEICFDITDENYSGKMDLDETLPVLKVNVEKELQMFIDTKDELKKFMEEKRLPGRIVYGLEIVMKRYLQLIQSRHSFDIEGIIGKAFQNFVKCTGTNIESIRELENPSEKDIQALKKTGLWELMENEQLREEIKYEELQKFLKALNTFRERISDYLADMQRSDSLFLEGCSLSHPAIGSATKLLFFYNWFMDQMKEKIDPLNADKYSFIVMSGGTDQTQAIDLFAHLSPADDEACSVILITVPEASLYDVYSSLFHVLHELLHFAGERKRKERMGYIVEALCRFISCVFTDFLEKEQEEFVFEYLVQLENYMSTQIASEMKKEVEKVFSEHTQILKKQLTDMLRESISLKLRELPEEFYYGRYIYEQIAKTVKEVFREKYISEFVYDAYMSYQSELMNSILKIVKKYKIFYSAFHLNLQNLEYRKRYAVKIEESDHEKKLVEHIIELFLSEKRSTSLEDILFDKNDKMVGLDEILEVLRDIFKECYADCIAGNVFGIQPSEFIYSFVTETRNENDAFTTNIPNRLRMMVDFLYLFGVENAISENKTDGLDCLLKNANEKGVCYITKEHVIKWLNRILDKREQEERISALIDPVMDYIKECYAEWEKTIFEKLGDMQKIIKCSKLENESDMYEFMQYIANSWMYYAKWHK